MIELWFVARNTKYVEVDVSVVPAAVKTALLRASQMEAYAWYDTETKRVEVSTKNPHSFGYEFAHEAYKLERRL